MVGRKLTQRLITEKALPVSDLTLFDIVSPAKVEPDKEFRGNIKYLEGNFGDAGVIKKLAELEADLIFHLAAVVSGDAERNFEKGMDNNLHANIAFFEALRKKGKKSKIIFTSSIAVFGAPFPDKIDDEFLCAPMTSYGAQKGMTELLLSDYSRKGFLDGISIRLPTVCVRPGKPNLAASGFFSGIIREPLSGKEAILPVEESVRHWFASPKSAVDFLIHAARLDSAKLENRRAINMPGVSLTVAEQIEELRKFAGNDVVKKIKKKIDPEIVAIVKNWPENFAPERAIKLGFRADKDFGEIIRYFAEHDLHPN